MKKLKPMKLRNVQLFSFTDCLSSKRQRDKRHLNDRNKTALDTSAKCNYTNKY